MELYSYDGIVLKFDRIISRRWRGQTYAPSLKKAKSNLEYQFKTQNKYRPDVKISLPGKISIIET